MILVMLVLWFAGFAVFWALPAPGGVPFWAQRWLGSPAPHPTNLKDSKGPGCAPISIIIPARNEEHNLPVLLRSIRSQTEWPLEILVVDDASTDRTAACARELDATVIPSKPLPEGWRGKTWACHQGAAAAAGEVFLFLDADTWFEPEGLRKIIETFLAGEGVLSIGPYHAVQRPYEQLSAFFNLTMTAGMGAFTLLGSALPPSGLFGQMLMVDRGSYFRAGGHEAVKGRILENFALASCFQAVGVPLRCCGGKGALAFRMYPNGLRELIAGWVKGFASGAGRTSPPLLWTIVAWMCGMISVFHMLVLRATPESAALYLLFALQLYAMFRRIGAFRWYVALLYPVPLFFYLIVFARSALSSGRQVQWKGREIYAD